MARHALGGRNLQFFCVLAKSDFHHFCFAGIVGVRSRSVRVVILNVFRLKASVFQSAGDGQGAARSVGKRSGDVVSVRRSAVTGKLGVYFCAALFGVLQLFQNQNGASLAHYKAVAVLVKGAACGVGIVVIA